MDCVSESTLSSSNYQGGSLPANIVAGKVLAAARSDIVSDIFVTHSGIQELQSCGKMLVK